MDPLPPAASDLYGDDPATFVARRNALVKELRGKGDRAAAKAVAELRRPTVAAHALNQMAREHPDLLEGVLEAARELQKAQRRALSGVRVDSLRDSTRAHAAAVGAAVDVVAADLSGSTAEEVRRTLLAAAVDPTLAARLRSGTLSTTDATVDPLTGLTGAAPLSAVELDGVDSPSDTSVEEEEAAGGSGESPADADRRRAVGRALKAVAEARVRHTSARDALTTARADVAAARAHRSEAEEAVRAAAERVRSANETVAAAERMLAQARAAESEAAEALAIQRGRADEAAAALEQATDAQRLAENEAQVAVEELEAAEVALGELRD